MGEQVGELASRELGTDVCAMSGLFEEMRVGVEGHAGAGVAEDAADLDDVEADVDDQMAGEGVTEIVEAHPSAGPVEPCAGGGAGCHRCSACWLLRCWTRCGENEPRAQWAQLLERKRRQAQQRIDESQPINEIRRRLIATLDHWKDLGLGGSIEIGRRACVVICLPLIHLAHHHRGRWRRAALDGDQEPGAVPRRR